MKGIIKTIGYAIIILSISITTCFASTNSNIKQIFDNESINNASEKNEISKLMDDNDSNAMDSLKQYKTLHIDIIKRDTIIKAYKFNTSDIVSDYKKMGNLGKLISNKYVWLSPIIDSTNKIVSMLTIAKGISVDEFNKLPSNYEKQSDKDEMLKEVKKVEGKWFVAETGLRLSSDQINFISDRAKIEKVLSDNNIKDITEIKFVLAESHFANILYIKSGTSEYGIPFSSRSDFTRLEDGKLYPLTEIMTKLSSIFSDGVDISGDTNGGAPNSGTLSITPTRIILPLLLVLLFVTVFLKKIKFSKSLFREKVKL